jgi:hypothetical protein
MYSGAGRIGSFECEFEFALSQISSVMHGLVRQFVKGSVRVRCAVVALDASEKSRAFIFLSVFKVS